MTWKPITGLFLMAVSSAVRADYYATGPIEGQVCSGIVIQACGFKTVAAVEGSNGRIYEVTRRFATVSSFNESTQRCIVRIKTRGDSIISWGIDALKNPTFYELSPSGRHVAVDVEYLSFKCHQR